MKALAICSIVLCGIWAGSRDTAQAQSYSWTTIAGVPGQRGSPDGIHPPLGFNSPASLAIDAGGNLYVGEYAGHQISKLSSSGTNWTLSLLAGMPIVGGADGTNTNARFGLPLGLAVSAAGNLYVGDTGNHTIRQIKRLGTNWVVTTIAGQPGITGSTDGTNSTALFDSPKGIVVDAQEALYVTDAGNHTIRRLVQTGTNWVTTTLAGLAGKSGIADGTNSDARFNMPFGLARDRSGNLYVSDTGNRVIRKITSIGTNWVVTTIAGAGENYYGTYDGTNNIASIEWPLGIAVDNGGNLYVADFNPYTIRKVTPSGTNWVVTTIGGKFWSPGSQNGIGEDARFKYPVGVAVDDNGNVFVADMENHTIRLGMPGYMLQMKLSVPNPVLSWPLTATNYTMEMLDDLSYGASWTPVTNGTAISGDNYILTIGRSAKSSFYRLRKKQ